MVFGKIQAKRSLNKAENERREKDLEEAKQIQESMLPKSFPNIKGLEITAGLITSTEVGEIITIFSKVIIKIRAFM